MPQLYWGPTLLNNPLVERLAKIPGRTFLVGDVHGHFDLLETALAHVHFRKSVDRLVSVGDLVDRGPASHLADDYIRQLWFYAVRGNHEGMFLECYASGRIDAALLSDHIRQNGGAWWLGLSMEQQWDLLDSFRSLPLALEIETEFGLVGVVHAQVPTIYATWASFKKDLHDERCQMETLWGRSRLIRGIHFEVEGVHRVYAGHSILPAVTQLGNHFFIDTGSFLAPRDAGFLTVLDLDKHLAGGQPTRVGALNLLA